jgi:hypothetical protein
LPNAPVPKVIIINSFGYYFIGILAAIISISRRKGSMQAELPVNIFAINSAIQSLSGESGDKFNINRAYYSITID